MWSAEKSSLLFWLETFSVRTQEGYKLGGFLLLRSLIKQRRCSAEDFECGGVPSFGAQRRG